MKVAIVHYWLVNMRGGEKVVEALCELYPQADIFTLVYDPKAISERLKKHKIIPSFVQKIPGAKKHYQSLLPLYPLALEQFDLSAYDLVISSESGPAKGVLTRPETCHICYCHTPMRYLWDMYHDYRRHAGFAKRMLMPPLALFLRQWDLASASRVDHFVANSRNVANRVMKHYRRSAAVVHPPVETSSFAIAPAVDDYYLLAGQLVRYKRADLAVEACTRLNRPLMVLGEGDELPRLRRLAGPNVQFLGRQPDSVLREYFSRCRAFLFPGEEDFGITPLEAQACGRPVIALGRGGALETVKNGETGLFFEEQTVESLIDAIKRFEATENRFHPETIRNHSLDFDESHFRSKMTDFIEASVEEHFRKFRGNFSR